MCVPASLLRAKALANLAYSDGHPDDKTEETLRTALSNIAEWSVYKQHYVYLQDLPEPAAFLQEAAYRSMGIKPDAAMLFAATLGMGIDQRIRRLSVNKLSEAIVLNAVANAYLEARSELFIQNTLSSAVLFCPGYAGTAASDIREILNLLQAQKYLGIYLNEAGLMLPEKSLAGIILPNYRFSCRSCIIRSKCTYLKQGKTCYENLPLTHTPSDLT